MQTVAFVRTTGRRNDMGIGQCLWQLRNDLVHARANASLIGIHGFTCQQRHVLGLEVQILDQVVVNAP